MKKLVFSLAAIAFVSLSSFTSIPNAEERGTVPCKWRTVYHHSNGDVSYTEWTHGNCNVSDSGVLSPIK